jgi:toxin CcdB
VVVPLVRSSAVSKILNARFNPTLRVRNTAVVLHPLEIASVPNDRLREPVGSLAAEGDRIMAALDELFTRACGAEAPGFYRTDAVRAAPRRTRA